MTRPVLSGMNPDPSICRVGDRYYLVTSTFEYAPGVPVHTSRDLREWTLTGHALSRPSQLDVTGAPDGNGILAPTIRHHDGRFWMITTNLTDVGGQILVSTTDPVQGWSDPVRIPEVVGIDPDLAWDEDGTCYLTFAARGGIQQVVFDPETGRVLSDPVPMWSGSGGASPEAPHLYRIGEFWYLLIAEGGTERGHSAVVARSQGPSGPFEANPANPVLTRRGTTSVVQNAGHGDLVQTGPDTWVMVYLGVRPRGTSPQWHVLGRETFAVDVTFVDGWPVLGDDIEPAAPQGTQEDWTAEPPPTWMAANVFPDEVTTSTGNHLEVRARDDRPTFVGRRQDAFTASLTARFDAVDGRAGLAVRLDSRHVLAVEVADGRAVARWTVGGVRHTFGEVPVELPVTLEVRAAPQTGNPYSVEFGPDTVSVGVLAAQGFTSLGSIDGRYLSTEVAGGMTGRLMGVSVESGHALVTDVRYRST